MRRIGRYEVTGEIARGGMGAVLRARDPALRRDVAIKVMLAGGRATETQRRRFLREADALARLRHPNIVAVHEVGHDAQGLYLVMDLVEGESLERRVSREGPLPAPEALRVTEVLARAIAHAHAHGVLHRDLKPANVLVGRDGTPFVTDFGLAREVEPDEASRALSHSGVGLGTPGYWPPEQAFGQRERIGPRSDVYGLGATLHALLTGEPPYAAPSLIELLCAMQQQDPPPPSSRRPGLSPEVDALVRRALARDPEDRWPSVEAFADALAAARRRRRRARRTRWPLVVGAAGLLGLAAVVAVGVAVRRGASGAPAPPTALGPAAEVASAGTPGAGHGDALRAAAAALEAGRRDDARALLDALLAGSGLAADDARRTDALALRGRARADAGDDAGAIADWRAALALAPARQGVRLALVVVLGEAGDAAAVAEEVTRGLDAGASGEQAAELHAMRAWARRLDDRPGALADWDAALALALRPDWLVSRAVLRAEAGDLAAARADLDAALARAPDPVQALRARSAVLVRQGERDLARADLDRALELAPARADLWVLRSELRRDGGDRAGEVADLDRAIAADPAPAEAYRRRAAARAALGDLRGALADHDQVLARAPEDVTWRLNRGVLRQQVGDLEGALADLDEVVRRAPGDGHARAARSAARRERGDDAGALVDSEQAIALAPDDPDAWFALAVSRRRAGENEAAREAYERATALRPAYWAAWTNLSDVRRQLGDPGGAVVAGERALELDPARPESLLVLALALLDRGAEEDLRRSEDLFVRYLERRPDDAAPRFNLAVCRENRGDLAGARDTYRRALELLAPDSALAARARDRLEKLDRALGR